MSHVTIDTKGLDFLRGSEMNVIIRRAMNTAAAPVKAAVVAAAPKDLGNLAKAFRIKNVYYKQTKTWVSLVGVSRAYQRSAGRKALTRKVVWRGKGKKVVTDELVKKFIRPVKYALAREHRKPFIGPAGRSSSHIYAAILPASIRVQVALRMPKK